MGKAKGNVESEKKDFPGVPVDVFKAAVETVVDLVNTGKFLVFLGRASSIRIIGNEEDFVENLLKRKECQGLEKQKAVESLRELGRYARAYGVILSEEDLVEFFIRRIYDDEIDKLEEEEKKSFKDILQSKVRLVKDSLYSDGLRDRRLRLDTSTAPCLEDLDYELVRERRSVSSGRRVNKPFLRLCVRNSKEKPGVFPFFGTIGVMWGEGPPEGLDSFEIECDESDIDLLLLRLKEAKDLLLEERKLKSGN